MGPFTFVTWRCALAGLAMIPVLYVMKAQWPRRERWLDYGAVGLFLTTGLFGLLIYGMQFVSAGKTAVLLYTMPMWTSLAAHFYLKETLSANRWIGIACGALGIGCILGWDIVTIRDSRIIFGEAMVVMAALSWTVANMWMKKRLSDDNPFTVNGVQSIIGAIGLAAIAFAHDGGVTDIHWTPLAMFSIVFTAIIASTVNFTIWFYLLKRMDTHTVAHAVMLVPVFGLTFDWLILDSSIDLGLIAGGALILLGIYIVSNKK